MALSLVTTQTQATAAASTDPATFTVPIGVQPGDKVIVSVVHGDVTLTVTVGGGSAVTLHTGAAGAGLRTDSWSYTVDWNETTYPGTALVFTPASSDTITAIMYVVRGNHGYELDPPTMVTGASAVTSYALSQPVDGRVVAGTSYHVVGSSIAQTAPTGLTADASVTTSGGTQTAKLYRVNYALHDWVTTTTFHSAGSTYFTAATQTLSPAPTVAAPTNDTIATAVALTAGAVTVGVNLGAATHQPNEEHPYQRGVSGTLPGPTAIRSAWYTYTPTATGRIRVRVNSDQTLGRATVAVWSSASTTFPLDTLAGYNEDDYTYDSPGASAPSTTGSLGSVAYVDATAATTYYIQVLDVPLQIVPTAAGIPVTVEVADMPALAGDTFAAAVALGADSGHVTISTHGAAGAETGEPNGYLDTSPPAASVWRTFTPTVTGAYQFAVAPYFNDAVRSDEVAPLLFADVWSGTAVGSLTLLANHTTGDAVARSNAPDFLTSTQSLTASTTYHVRLYVAHSSAPATTFEHIDLTWGPLAVPTNETAASAEVLDLLSPYVGPTYTNTFAFDSTFAVTDVDPNDLYWKFTARPGTYTVALATSINNTDCSFWDTGTSSVTGGTFPATGGETVYIRTRTAGFGGGPDSFTLEGPAALPAPSVTAAGNNAFAAAYRLPGDYGSATTSLVGATQESGEPALPGSYTASFTARAALPAARTWANEAAYDPTGSGTVYIGGGNSTAKELLAYDVAGNSWTALASMTNVHDRSGLAYKAAHVYVFGGSSAPETAEKYTIATNTWSAITAPPVPHTDAHLTETHAFTGSGNDIYILAGGFDATTSATFAALWRYDTVADTYTTLTAPPSVSAIQGIAAFTGTKLIYVDSGDLLTRVYTVAGGTWVTSSALIDAFVDTPALFVAPTGELVLLGGYPDSHPGSRIQVYDPAADAWATATTTLATRNAYAFWVTTPTGGLYGGGFDYDGATTTTSTAVHSVTVTGTPGTGGTVWFSWVPAAGAALLSTDRSPSAWQGRIDVYTGSAVSSLTSVTAGVANVSFTSTGATYRIRLSGATAINNAVLSYLGQAAGDGGASADLALAPTAATLASSPGTVTVGVSNGTPGATVDFSIDGISGTALSAALDAGGSISAISVPIAVTAAGAYTLRATSGSASATTTVTVTEVATTNPIGADVPTPPTPVTDPPGVRRWVFQDTYLSDTYTFAINPHEMTSPFGAKRIQYQATTAINGAKIAFEAAQPPVEWQFTGTILTQDFYDHLVTWRNKKTLVWLTDHYKRAWLIYVLNLDVKPQRSVRHPWRHEYTMTVSVFDGPIQQT